MARRAILVVCAAWCGCAPMVEPVLVLSTDRASFDGRTERVVVKVRAWDELERPAGGLVKLSSPVGDFVGGSELILDHGSVSGTFACDPAQAPACLGAIRLNAEWSGMNATVQVIGVEPNPPRPVEWEVVPTLVAGKLYSVVADRNGVVWGVGERGSAVQLVGRTWRPLHTGVRATLRSVIIGPRGAPVAVGDDGVVLEWNGGGFTRWSAGDHQLTAVAFDAHQQLHVGTAAGLILAQTDEGFVGELQLTTPVRSLAVQGGELWATGEGVLAKWSNGAWLSLPPPVTGTLELAVAGEQSLWLAGQREGAHTTQGLLVSGPMPTWKSAALPEPVRGVVEVPGVAEKFVFGPTSLFRQLDEGEWKRVPCPGTALAGASRGPNDLVLVGPEGISLLRKP